MHIYYPIMSKNQVLSLENNSQKLPEIPKNSKNLGPA